MVAATAGFFDPNRPARIMAPPMFVVLSKIFDLLLAPLTWAVLLLLLAALLRGRPRLAWGVAVLAVAQLLAFSTEPVADALFAHLESSATRTDRPEVTYDAVIVLGGAVDSQASRASGELELMGTADRVVKGYEVLRSGHAQQLLYSCGVVDPVPGDVPESVQVVEALKRWGIQPAQLLAETSSRNTRENAVESARVVARQGWKTLLLVTSAAHMERSLGCFRAVGLHPDTLPVDRRAGDGRNRSWVPRAASLSRSTDALRELAGRVVYRIMGYTAPP